MSSLAVNGVPQYHSRQVLLLRADPDLRKAIPADDLEVAERVQATSLQLPAGPWHPEALPREISATTVAIVVRGMLTSEIELAGARNAQLHGNGDLLLPWDRPDAALPFGKGWAARPGGAEIILLGQQFKAAQERWPQLGRVLQLRFAAQAEAAVLRAAIVSLPRVEQRILGLFWQLAERWGKVGPNGVRLELKLTHELIGRLAGAKRPTVSLALSQLAEQQLVQPCDGGWMLSRDSVRALERPLAATAA